MVNLDKVVGLHYDNAVGDGSQFRFEVESELPKAMTAPDYERITDTILREFGKSEGDYQALMFRRDLDGNPINYSLETSGWVKVIDGIKTRRPIRGIAGNLKPSGIVTDRPDVTERISELFETLGYTVEKRYE